MNMRILVLHGPNLNLLGSREPEVYGRDTLADINRLLQSTAQEVDVELDIRQSNHEGELVEWIHESAGSCAGIVFNPAAYTHTSVALRDALQGVDVPCLEVHLSNPAAREVFRRESLTAPACIGQIAGLGKQSYRLALVGLVGYIRELETEK